MALGYSFRMRNEFDTALEIVIEGDEGFREGEGKVKETRKAKSLQKKMLTLLGRLSYINSEY